MNHDEIEKVALEELQAQHNKEDFGEVDKLHKAIASAIAEAFDAHYEQVHYNGLGTGVLGPV
jgi:DNA-binding GntR family transcriptional regulator